MRKVNSDIRAFADSVRAQICARKKKNLANLAASCIRFAYVNCLRP
jgi:hypothetical protein